MLRPIRFNVFHSNILRRYRLRRQMVSIEAMEPRTCPSSGLGLPSPTGSGVDAMAMGDFNADRVADIAVASHQGGHYIVTIYNGVGQSASTTTGFAPMVLATITDPLGRGVGPLDVAAGDFTGAGVSDLAIRLRPGSRSTRSPMCRCHQEA